MGDTAQRRTRATGVPINRWALADARELAGYTKRAVATGVGISLGYYSDIESGRRQRIVPDLLIRLAEFLCVHVGTIRANRCGPDCPCRSER